MGSIISTLHNYFKQITNATTSESSQTKLTTLPNELLIGIFERVPLNDLLHNLSLTNVRFVNLVRIIRCQHCILVLVFGAVSYLVHPFSSTKFGIIGNSAFLVAQCNRPSRTLQFVSIGKWLTRNTARQIVNTFPNVRSLQLSTNDLTIAQLDEVINNEFLLSWHTSLEALQLILNIPYSIDQESTRVLLNTNSIINSATRLRRLALTVWHSGEVNFDMPIMGQLKEFYFCSYNSTNVALGKSIHKYILPNESLKHIGLCTKTTIGDKLIETIATNRMFASKLTHLRLCDSDHCPLDDPRLGELLVQLPNLMALYVSWYEDHLLVPLIRALQPITSGKHSKLAFLKLDIVNLFLPDRFPNPDRSQLDLSSLVNIENCVPVRLMSIRALKVHYETWSHESMHRFHLDKIFPNLSEAYFTSVCKQCHTCQYTFLDSWNWNVNYTNKIEQCIKVMVTPLLQMVPTKPNITFEYWSRSGDLKKNC